MFGKLLDNLALTISPRWGANRIAHREYATRIKAAAGVHQSMQKMLGGGRNGGYEAGKIDRLKGRVIGSPHENDVPQQQINALRWRSWNLYRNCPQARKICRTLGAKAIGRGLSPQPQTTTIDGDPFVDFRRRARQVWEEFSKECDWRGKPGSGGQHLVPLSKTALRGTILSGGVLFRFHHLDAATQKKLGLLVPLQVQLLHVDRLDENKHGGNIFRGVELDDAGRVVAYWILKGGATDSIVSQESVRVEATEIKHLHAEEDIDQILGAPWLGAALLTMDDRRGYEYSELVAAEMASCMVAGYRRSSGQMGGPGLSGPGSNGDRDLTDADGNPVTHLQPGMFLDLGQSGEMQILNPSRPNNGAGEFLSYLLRGEAVGVPGVKSSTLTGDYRNSSFSSERSADNDVWPEIEELQDWFAVGFCQPIYEECITAAIGAGLFDDVEGFDVADFNARKREYLKTNWQGPVPRSINPKDDADAARLRVQNGTSSPQREAAQIGRDWREILQEVHEYIDYAEGLDVPDDIWQQALGIQQSDQGAAAVGADGEPITAPAPAKTEQEQDDEMAAARFRNSGFYSMNHAGQQ